MKLLTALVLTTMFALLASTVGVLLVHTICCQPRIYP